VAAAALGQEAGPKQQEIVSEESKRVVPMTYVRRVFTLSFVVALNCFLCHSTWAQVSASSLNDRARFLAAMPVADGSPLKALEGLPAYQEQSKVLSAQWQDIQKKRWNNLSAWAAAEIEPHINPASPVFYMFGGPDILNAYLNYPGASKYILCGLEAVGRVPALEKMTRKDIESTLSGVHASIQPALDSSFFVTGEMSKSLRHGELYGLLQVFYVFLARTDNTIENVEYLKLDEKGKLTAIPEESTDRDGVRGVKITFTHAGASVSQELYYFREDVSDKALSRDNRFLSYLNALGEGNSYLKAASYLMHTKEFILIRDFLLSRSSSILQDDSGIPYRYFRTGTWQVTLYGSYSKPISGFRWAVQEDLQKAYLAPGEVRPMPFKTGYGTQENANLLFARRAPAKAR